MEFNVQASGFERRRAASDCVGDKAERTVGDGRTAKGGKARWASRAHQAASVVLRTEELQVSAASYMMNQST